MRDLYSDDESVAGDGERLIPDGVRRLTGAAVFLGLIAAMAVWSWRLGTRDAAEVPVIRAMEGASRIQPEDPGGAQAAHQGLEVNAVLAGRPAPMPRAPAPAAPEPPALAPEDGPQGELVLAAPAVLAERVFEEDGDLPMPQQEDLPEDFVAAAPEFAPPAAAPEPPAAAPGTRPRGRPANLVVARAKTAPVASTPAAPAAHEVSSVKAGARLVQLGAFDSEANTRKAWAELVARHGDLLGSKSLYVERTTGNARVFYRLRVAGFANPEETRAMCEALRARGIDCIPVTLQ
jgi:sporulation related protein